MADLDAIRARANAATPGPWTLTTFEDVLVPVGPDTSMLCDRLDGQADAEFIKHAREDVPALLDEIARLREYVETTGYHQQRHADAVRENAKLTARLDAVRALHKPVRIYDECGHEHTDTEPGIRNVEEVGLVCEDGYRYSICAECCCDESEYQTERCVDSHDREYVPCCPCPTLRALDGESEGSTT